MFYERFLFLCKKSGVAPSTAATAAGFNRGTVSVWKKKFENGIDVSPDSDTIEKICSYFNCSELWLRGLGEKEKTPPESGEREISDRELMYALFGDTENISEADLEDVRRYAAFIKERKKEQ